jgi:signal peptide peptidase SppA
MFKDIYLQVDTLRFQSVMARANSINLKQYEQAEIEPTFNSILQKDGNKALITVDGPIIYAADDFEKFVFSAVDTLEIMSAVQDVAQDSKIEDVVFAINSPGGTAHKMHILSDMIYGLSQQKNTASVNVGIMASAAYYIASQTNQIYTDDEMNDTGSIGTKVVLYDRSEMFKANGIEVIPVATGEHKAMLEDGVKITPEHLEVITEKVNELQSRFSEAVARTRPADMSDGSEARSGRTFSYQKAQELGLVDGIKSIDEAFKSLSMGRDIKAMRQGL